MLKTRVRKVLDDIQTVPNCKIKNKIQKYDVLSFDIFDTLIKRDVPSPTSLFALMEYNLQIDNFCNNRIEAEKKARVKKGEVSLSDIYDMLVGIEEKQKLEIMKTEIEYEINLCTVNQDMIDIFKWAVDNKRVFLLSDMYLSREVIKSILDKNGIIGYEELIISNEVNKTKSDGQLFKYLEETYNCGNIVHIGNNFRADYISAKKNGLAAVKIKTNTYRLNRKFKHAKNIKYDYLKAFLSNHHRDDKDYYYNFGYECFGPVLYGFITWLYDDMKEEEIDEVYFMARDGYIMQEAYHTLGFDKYISDKYFEGSRRSLRVPSYCNNIELEHVIEESPLLSTTNMEQIFDSFGLDINQYSFLLKKYNFTPKGHLKRDELLNDKTFNSLYNDIKKDIYDNSEVELTELLSYLRQFDFNKKIAIVDIGWGGSMQKNLINTLNENNIKNNIKGYYLGLSKKSRNNLGKNGFKAKAYLFDCLNNDNDVDIEIAFRPLFETLFLEQAGSVKCYKTEGDNTCAVRYSYEYENNGILSHEAMKVKNIQLGAINFIKEFSKSKLSAYLDSNVEIMFNNLYETGTRPYNKDVKMFGDFRFFNNGSADYLAKRGEISKYITNPRLLLKDLSEAQWKIGFFKSVMKIRFPYLKMYMYLHNMINGDED